MMRLQRDLRTKITKLERKEQEDLTTVTSLVHDQAKRQQVQHRPSVLTQPIDDYIIPIGKAPSLC